MIVTRRRRKPFPWRRLILPAIAIALVIFAFVWGPSRNFMTSGPMTPMWQTVGTRFNAISAPFHFAAVNQTLTERNRQIVQLQAQVADLQAQSAQKDKQIASLNSQIGQLQTQAANASAATPAPVASAAAAAGGAPAAAGETSSATTQMRRTAEVWANMEPDNAAKVVQRLPIPYVAQVLALMSADDAGAILDSVPPKFAAEVTQENPGLKR